MICTQYLSVSSKGNNDCLSDICWKKKKKNKQTKKTASLLIFIQVEKINSKGGKIKELAHRKKKKKKKKEKAKKEGLTMRLPILSYNQADLSKQCGQIVFKR